MDTVIGFVAIGVVIYLIYVSKKADREKARRLLRIQAFLTGEGGRLKYTEAKLQTMLEKYIRQKENELNKHEKVLYSAESPKPYYKSMDDYLSVKADLEKLNNDVWPGQFSLSFLSINEIESLTNEMINRFWFSCQEKSASLATEQGRKKKLQSFFDVMGLYDNRLTDTNRRRVQKIKREFEEKERAFNFNLSTPGNEE